MGLTVVNVGGLDIIDGNRKMTLAIMWQLMRRHTLNLLQVRAVVFVGVSGNRDEALTIGRRLPVIRAVVWWGWHFAAVLLLGYFYFWLVCLLF